MRSLTRASCFASVLLVGQLVGGCASGPSGPAASPKPAARETLTEQQKLERQETEAWSENEAFIEWQVARRAAGCYEAAATSRSSPARREASRLNASYALSSYAVMSGRSPLVQGFTLVGMAELLQQVWVEEGRAATVFGEQSKPVVAAIVDIRKRTREHAAKYLSAAELQN